MSGKEKCLYGEGYYPKKKKKYSECLWRGGARCALLIQCLCVWVCMSALSRGVEVLVRQMDKRKGKRVSIQRPPFAKSEEVRLVPRVSDVPRRSLERILPRGQDRCHSFPATDAGSDRSAEREKRSSRGREGAQSGRNGRDSRRPRVRLLLVLVRQVRIEEGKERFIVELVR